MATLAEGKRLDMLSSRQKSQLEKTGSFKTSSGTLYTPTDMDMAATASRGGKDLQALSTFMSANPDMTVPQTATPPTVDATTIGTPAPTAPTPPKNEIATKLAQIESQALALKETIDQRAAAEAEGTTAAPGGLTGGDTSTGTPTGMPAAPGGSFAEMGDQALQQYLTQAMGGFELSPEAQQLQTESAQANLAAKNMANDLVAYATSTREEIMRMRQNPEGKSMGAMQAGIANYEYDRYNGKDGYADMAIAAQYALNNAEYAYEIANNAVSAERDQFDSQLQMFKDIFTMSRNDMTQSEQMQYQSQLRIYETQTQSLMESKEVAMQRASQSGAPAEVLTAIKNATTPEQVWQSAGVYGEDPQLDMQRQQLAISRGNLALAYDKFEWDKWHADRQLQIEAGVRAGEIAAEDAEKVKMATAMLKNNAKLLNATQEALNNKLGLRAATGRYKAGFFDYVSGGILGGAAANNARENFENDIKLIAAAQTLEEFSNLGFSLAPVTEKELDLVGSSANEVLSSVRVSEDGTIEIKGSTAEFEKNLQAFQVQTQAAFDALMNDPYLQQGVLGGDLESMRAEYEQMTGQSTANVAMPTDSYFKISETLTNQPTR